MEGFIGIVVVTGAGSGIGKAVSEIFAKNGYYVYALFRSAENGVLRQLNNGVIEERVCDVTDEESIKTAFLGITSIDILINVAGCGIFGSAECTSNKDVHFQFETNYFGTLNVNRYALPIMRKAQKGLVMITSSVGGIYPLPFQGQYSATKAALEAYAGALYNELRPFGVRVTVIEPGDASTPFTKRRKTTEDEDSPYKAMADFSLKKAEDDENNGYSAERVALTYFRVAKKKNPSLSYAVGFSYKFLVFLKRIFPKRFMLFVLRKMYM